MNRTITEHELCDDVEALLDAVESGQTFIVTRDGRSIAEFGAISAEPPRDAARTPGESPG